ncbi:MAG: undecaprenyldiphospho-muramoylpentapeptide beta-N-acetylglucosaminyltransferase [Bauldia sp.]|nr:undecaprenyldiphospho-muramoylpentapeptide beta-N-acetylglucosaminyltransferase [Bauldia sp.]
MAGTILLCAGGTGGHLFPAEALALVLEARGWQIELATDHRAVGYGGNFPAEATHIVPSATFSGRGIPARIGAVLKLASGFFSAFGMVGRVKPAAVVGFGGYPTVPPVLAARYRGVPTIIHDQNAVLGRANRFLAPRVTKIAVGSPALKLPARLEAKAVPTGNPVRVAVRDAARRPYPALAANGPLDLLVFGGSQGARFLSEIVPAAIGQLPPELRGRLRLVQQCRPEDLGAVEATYRRLNVTAELAPFFRNLPDHIARSHLVISRSGASTVAELAVIGRPAILIPLPGAIDQDQMANARTLADIGGAWLVDERGLTPEALAAELSGLMSAPERLQAAAAAAAGKGQADGAEKLADLVEAVARKEPAVPATTRRRPVQRRNPPPRGGALRLVAQSVDQEKRP